MKYLASSVVVIRLTLCLRDASAQTIPFEDTFDGELSDQWQINRLSRFNHYERWASESN
jgi:hypothetical protein